MATTGRSTDATTTAETPATATTSELEKAMLKELAHLRRKLALHADGQVEPGDIETEDYIKNVER